MPHASLGRPLLLGKELDAKIAEYIHALRLAGGIVNRSIVQAAAKGVVAQSNPSQLQEHGGHLQIGVKWTESFLRRRGYVKRKATKAARKLPPNFEDLKPFYRESAVKLSSICYSSKTGHQTGSKLVPVSQWTLAEQGSTQVRAQHCVMEQHRETLTLVGANMSLFKKR